MVATAHIVQHTVVVVGQTQRDILVVATPGTGFGRRGQKDLYRRIRQHHRADVTALDDDVARPFGQLSLQGDKPDTHGRNR